MFGPVHVVRDNGQACKACAFTIEVHTTMESKPVPSKVLRERQIMPCKFDPKSDCSFYGFDKLRSV